MKPLFAFVTLVLLLFSSQFVSAGLPLGGNIKYKSLGGNKYYLETTVLIDCNGPQYATTSIYI
ncbi:MAG: hypothetical protein ACKVJP_03780 [Flavobacteriales bacterium]|jgi:hypothetical protein